MNIKLLMFHFIKYINIIFIDIFEIILFPISVICLIIIIPIKRAIKLYDYMYKLKTKPKPSKNID